MNLLRTGKTRAPRDDDQEIGRLSVNGLKLYSGGKAMLNEGMRGIWNRFSNESGEVDAFRSRSQVPLKSVEAADEQTIKSTTQEKIRFKRR